MFFPAESLRRGGRFYLCWVADSWPLRFATITHKQLWSQDIRHICDDLLEVMKNESGRPANRFSLRLSSQLLRGLVRLYQRKVSVFVGEICMINARVMKVTNKKWAYEADDEPVHRRPHLSVLAIEEQADEERVVERIQNSGNVVANVEDITLKEPTMPENQTFLDDGFGELQLQERAMELQMRAGAEQEQPSALSLLAADESALARSRLELSPLRAVMEGISEHEISVFQKSMGESQLPAADFDKEIPDMPEIHPDLPAPQDNKGPEVELTEKQPVEPVREDSAEKRKRDNEEFKLDELQEQPLIKRRRKNKLIKDKNIKLTSQFMASRLENVDVELRCERGSDRMSILVPAAMLLNRPAHAGYKVRSNLGYTLTRLFIRNLDTTDKQHAEDREMEKALTARQKRSLRPAQKNIVEEPIVENEPREVQQEVLPDVSNIPIDADFTLLPTQIVVTSPEKRISELEHSPKRIRRSGFVSFRLNQQLGEILQDANDKENVPQNYQSVVETNDKENVPQNYQSVVETNEENVPENQQNVVQLSQMLLAEGLADVERAELSERPKLSERSETPLGSLDRTKVSLGDSEKTTDSKRFIREEWGTEGTMHKIYRGVRAARGPVCVRSLLARGPLLAGHTRLIAARCFTSVLKLKQHGFIKVLKDPETYEIVDIQLGSKITLRK